MELNPFLKYHIPEVMQFGLKGSLDNRRAIHLFKDWLCKMVMPDFYQPEKEYFKIKHLPGS
jgi:hypothetical protein